MAGTDVPPVDTFDPFTVIATVAVPDPERVITGLVLVVPCNPLRV